MNKSKVAVAASAAGGKILSVLGYLFGITMLLGVLIALLDNSSDMDPGITVGVMLFWEAACVFAVIKGRQIKHRIKRYKQYVALISAQQMTALENLAASTGQSVDFVRKDLQTMIGKRFFVNATIDMAANEIVIGRGNKGAQAASAGVAVAQEEQERYSCAGCGASGAKPKGRAAQCDYCGSVV